MNNKDMKDEKIRRRRRRKGKLLFPALCVCVSLAAGTAAGAAVWKLSQERRSQGRTEETPSQAPGSATITYNGEAYRYNTQLTNLLFLGVDKTEEAMIQNTPGKAGQTDCIMLVTLDHSDGTASVLQISRDTMTGIDLYDLAGNYYTTVNAQLATQYAYGNGGQSSCWATEKTVSELLYQLPIDGYFSMTIEGIGVLNDALGGVELTIPADYTQIDPVFQAGSVITLNGQQAERYVRTRDVTEFGSNEGRMERQTQYITALFENVRGKNSGNTQDFYSLYFNKIEPYTVTDLNEEQINALATYDYQEEKTAYLPGEIRNGAEHEEFYVDEDALRSLLIQRYYVKADQ